MDSCVCFLISLIIAWVRKTVYVIVWPRQNQIMYTKTKDLARPLLLVLALRFHDHFVRIVSVMHLDNFLTSNSSINISNHSWEIMWCFMCYKQLFSISACRFVQIYFGVMFDNILTKKTYISPFFLSNIFKC